MNQSFYIKLLEQKIVLHLGVSNYRFSIIRQTPNSSTFKLAVQNKSYYVKTFRTLSSFKNETQFSRVNIIKYNFTPQIIFTGKIDFCPSPFFLVRESSDYISLDKFLNRNNSITESICFKIGEKLFKFHSMRKDFLYSKEYSIKYLINTEYIYWKKFYQENLDYFNLAFNLANDNKAKEIICDSFGSIQTFIKSVDDYLEKYISMIKHYPSTNSFGLVHGDLWIQNIIYNEILEDIQFIDFNNTHFGNIDFDLVRFKLRGTSIQSYYSIEELHIDESLWSSFLAGYFSRKQSTKLFDSKHESIIILLILLRTVNHYLNYSWLNYLNSDSNKVSHFSKLLKILIVMSNYISNK